MSGIELVPVRRDIDKAMELGYRQPPGPLKLTDLVGLDVRLGIAEYLQGTLGTDAFESSRVVTPTRRPRLRKSL